MDDKRDHPSVVYEPTAEDLAVLDKVRKQHQARYGGGQPSQEAPGQAGDPSDGGRSDGGRSLLEQRFEPQQQVQDRLTVVENVYHQPTSGDTAGSEFSWWAWLSSDAQPYGRKVKVGCENWQPIGYGWLDEDGVGVSQLCLRNASEDPEAVVTVGVVVPSLPCDIGERVVPFARLKPGQSCRLEPDGKLSWRSANGQATCYLTAFPE